MEKLDLKRRLEIFRDILHIAIDMNFNEELLLKISKELDKHIVEYMQENGKLVKKNNN